MSNKKMTAALMAMAMAASMTAVSAAAEETQTLLGKPTQAPGTEKKGPPVKNLLLVKKKDPQETGPNILPTNETSAKEK